MQNKLPLLALCLLACAVPAWAHAHLRHADPAASAVLKVAPAKIDLDFTEALEPAFSSITVSDDKGGAMNAAPSIASGSTMHVALKKLGPGHYHVHWVSVAIDTHRTSGDYDFSVAP